MAQVPEATAGERTAQVSNILNLTVIVSALGYFVDIYDLLLFSIVRVPSLEALGLTGDALLETGVFLLNAQMLGLLTGGIIWGVLGDKRGRVSVLFGSIALYSLANIANAFVTNVEAYAVLRFVAGVGLAGELGAAVTLVSEVMTKETRGYGTAVVASVGILGAVVGGLVGNLFSWQTAYLVGGGMGLLLLTLRVALHESGMFNQMQSENVRRGDLRMLFADGTRLRKYAYCILIGLPIWYVVGVLITFSPEFGRELGVTGSVSAGMAVLWCYAGLSLGDLGSGVLSQRIKSRRWAVLWSICFTSAIMFAYLFTSGLSPTLFYGLCFLLGVGIGYWAVFVTVAAEQFGTNLRATVATTVPNFIRGSVVPITLAVTFLRPNVGLVQAALVVGVVCILIALFSLRGLGETYGKDLQYVEG